MKKETTRTIKSVESYTGEGKELHTYLRKNKVNFEDLANKMGYAVRHSLLHYFGKDKLPFEFKQKLWDAGIKLFNIEAANNSNRDLKDTLISLLEENKMHQAEAIQRLQRENEALRQTVSEQASEIEDLRSKVVRKGK